MRPLELNIHLDFLPSSYLFLLQPTLKYFWSPPFIFPIEVNGSEAEAGKVKHIHRFRGLIF